MKKLTTTIEITDESFALLKRLQKEGFAKFRDSEFDSFEHFSSTLKGGATEEDKARFYRRNFCGVDEMHELIMFDLVEDVDGSWNTTYKLSELGKRFIAENTSKPFENVETVIVNKFINDVTEHYWYKIGDKFKVKQCQYGGQMNDVEGFGNVDPQDCLIVTEGEHQGNLIHKKHVTIIE